MPIRRGKSKSNPTNNSESDTYSKTITHVWRSYCKRTSLHGLKYIGDHRLMILERAFWTIAFASAVTFASYFVYQIYYKYDLNPVIMSINPLPVSTNDIPFPAIKICNMNQAKKSVVEKINKKNSVEKTLLKYLCDTTLDINKINQTLAVETTTWDRLIALLNQTSQTVDEMFRKCIWNSNNIDCALNFNTEVTDEGMCYTFNGLPNQFVYREGYMNDTNFSFDYPNDVGEWNPETGYKDYLTPKYPYRATGAGSNHGLYMILDANLDDYYCSSTNSAGFKLLLYVPSDNSKIKNFAYMIPSGSETQITVIPTIYDADFGLKHIKVEKRGCFFREERHLKYFRYYSLNNCRLECESNYTSNHCGCIPFHLPRERNEDLCMLIQLECAREAAEIMNEIETDTLQSRCRCLPNCYEIEYNINFSYGSLSRTLDLENLTSRYETRNTTAKYRRKNFAIVSIFFGENNFDRYTKRLIYSFPDFLSSTGGLLGLFLGFSWLSIVEVIYFLIKLFVNLCRVRRELHQAKMHNNRAMLNSLFSDQHHRY